MFFLLHFPSLTGPRTTRHTALWSSDFPLRASPGIRSTVGAVYEGVNKLAVSTMSAVRWLLSAVYCTCFADQTTKSGQWVISSSKQVHYTSDNSQLTADKFRRLPDFFHSSHRPAVSPQRDSTILKHHQADCEEGH